MHRYDQCLITQKANKQFEIVTIAPSIMVDYQCF